MNFSRFTPLLVAATACTSDSEKGKDAETSVEPVKKADATAEVTQETNRALAAELCQKIESKPSVKSITQGCSRSRNDGVDFAEMDIHLGKSAEVNLDSSTTVISCFYEYKTPDRHPLLQEGCKPIEVYEKAFKTKLQRGEGPFSMMQICTLQKRKIFECLVDGGGASYEDPVDGLADSKKDDLLFTANRSWINQSAQTDFFDLVKKTIREVDEGRFRPLNNPLWKEQQSMLSQRGRKGSRGK